MPSIVQKERGGQRHKLASRLAQQRKTKDLVSRPEGSGSTFPGDSRVLVAKKVLGLWSVTTVNSTPSRAATSAAQPMMNLRK
ncbi:hypothetical protein WJX77_001126 [Trebouxia sp. C0004]